MQRYKFFGLLILSALFLFSYCRPSYSQAKQPSVKIQVDTENFVVEAGQKNYQSSFNLHTVVNGRKYFIDHVVRITVGIPAPVLDPSGKYIIYASNTGCGFEAEGMTVFIADVYGKKKAPILGRCRYLRPARFLSAKGKNYLLITGESESPEKDFWLYDLSQGEFALHADGEIKEIGQDLFSYGQEDDEGNFKPIGRVTMDTLINRGAPLKLLPRYPTHGLTIKKSVRVYESDSCYSENDKPSKTIAAANTRVLILTKCEDGGYEIYFDGYKGKVKKGTIRPGSFSFQNKVRAKGEERKPEVQRTAFRRVFSSSR